MHPQNQTCGTKCDLDFKVSDQGHSANLISYLKVCIKHALHTRLSELCVIIYQCLQGHVRPASFVLDRKKVIFYGSDI